MVPHADTGPNVIIHYRLVFIFRLYDQVSGRGRHKDSVTPGGTSGVHVLLPLIAVFTVRITGWERDLQFMQPILEDGQLFVKL